MIDVHFTLTYVQMYLMFATLASFMLYAYDKLLALKNSRNISRVSEFKLLLSSLFGGTIGSIFSMILFRHKVKKTSFLIKLTIVVLIQASFIYLYINKPLLS